MWEGLARGKVWTLLWVPSTAVCVFWRGRDGQDTPGLNKVLREFQSRPPRGNGTSPGRRNEEEKGPTMSPLLTARPRAKQLGAGEQGRGWHTHMHGAGALPVPRLGQWSPGRSGHTALLTCPDWGRRSCGQPGKGLMSLASGCRRLVLHIPFREQLVQGKGLIHACLHPSLCRGLLSPDTVENEDTKPLR